MFHSESPIPIPRWMLTLKYVMLALLGLTAIIAGLPAVHQLTDWDDYTAVWGLLVFASGSTAAWASWSPRHETAERWSGLALVSVLGGYAGGIAVWAVPEPGRWALLVLVLTITMVPTARVIYLISRSGVKGRKNAGEE